MRHHGIGVIALRRSLQLKRTVYIEVRERFGESLRHQRQEGLDLPFVGLELDIERDAVADGRFALYTQVKIVDNQACSVEAKMHRIKVHRQGSD